METAEDPVEIRIIEARETHRLRLDVLRPGRPPEAAHFQGDDEPYSCHFGAFRANRLLGIATLLKATLPGATSPSAYQLRGMATVPEVRRTGLGKALLQACIKHARQNNACILWCNARTAAVGFYLKSNFEILGDEFEIPDVGPHFRMVLRL